MKRTTALLVSFGLLLSGAPVTKKKAIAQKPMVVSGPPRSEARIVKYRPGNAERVYVQHGWQTMIELPKDEVYMDFLLGDTEHSKSESKHWIVNSFKNASFVSVRPLKNSQTITDLTITAESGHNVTLILEDVSHMADAHADTTVVIHADEQEYTADGKPKFATVDALEGIKTSIEGLSKKIDDQNDRIAAGLVENKQAALLYAEAEQHGKYKYNEKKAAEQPFGVQDIWNNGKHTYIRVTTTEAPTLYEFKDGKLNFTNWDLRNGVYFVPHVVDKGELRVGKKKIIFERKGVKA